MDNKKSNFEQIEYNQIDNTPFTKVRREDKYCLLVGNTQVTEWTTEEETDKLTQIENMTWNQLTSVIMTIVMKWTTIKEVQEKATEKSI